MPTITLNVHSDGAPISYNGVGANSGSSSCSNTVTYSNNAPLGNSAVRAEARRRLEAEESATAAAAAAAAADLRRKTETDEAALLEQRIRLRAQEEQIRLMAERLAIEEAARKAVVEKESAVAAEMERLRNRTPTEKLQDQIDELKTQIAAMRRPSAW